MLLDKVTDIFVKIDNFCLEFETEFKRARLEGSEGKPSMERKAGLCDSEVIAILILFHGAQFRNFKGFYNHIKKLR